MSKATPYLILIPLSTKSILISVIEIFLKILDLILPTDIRPILGGKAFLLKEMFLHTTR